MFRNRRTETAEPAPASDVTDATDLDDAAGDPDVAEPKVIDPFDEVIPFLRDDSSPDEIAAVAAIWQRQADASSEQASAARAEAESVTSAARAEANRILATADAAARELLAVAARAESVTSEAAERARVGHANVERQAGVLAACEHLAAVEREREDLGSQIGELAGNAARLRAELAETAKDIEAARETGDLDALAGLRVRSDAIADLISDAERRQGAAQARLAAIGDGSRHPGELWEARRHANRSGIRQALNFVQPDRPEAIADGRRDQERALADLAAQLRADNETAEAAERQRHRIVQLG